MRMPTFTFENEAIWAMLMTLVPLAIAFVLIILIQVLRLLF
ncbi:MAG TPA: hypothetical protein VGQ72_06640 [Pyrinomonadaceae bacterium]|nr:hypothetical protein [Pyrinomonadaceae bacterium]